MKRYSAERKESVIQKMVPSHNIPIPRLAEETDISAVTLYNWRKQARVEGIAVPADGKNPEKWSSEDEFAIVLEAASPNEAELAEYCRQKGLYAEQIEAWRKACLAEGAVGQPLVLHSDNGSPMKGSRMLETLRRLSVTSSFSRPRVSNDRECQGMGAVLQPLVQHGTRAQRLEVHHSRATSHGRGHGDTGTPAAGLP